MKKFIKKRCNNRMKQHGNGIYIIGTGGYCRVILELLSDCNLSVLGLFDDNKKTIPKLNDIPFLGHSEKIPELVPKNSLFIVAIGCNNNRKRYFERLHQQGYKTPTIFHPSAIISPKAKIGEGVIALPYSVISTNSEIGNGCILNTGAIIDHDVIIGEFCHINVRCCIGSYVELTSSYKCNPGEVMY